jgi:hypothetical protein
MDAWGGVSAVKEGGHDVQLFVRSPRRQRFHFTQGTSRTSTPPSDTTAVCDGHPQRWYVTRHRVQCKSCSTHHTTSSAATFSGMPVVVDNIFACTEHHTTPTLSDQHRLSGRRNGTSFTARQRWAGNAWGLCVAKACLREGSG